MAKSFAIDQALLTVVNTLNETIKIYAQLNECYECPLAFRGEVRGQSNVSIIIDTRWNSQLKVENKFEAICSEDNLALYNSGQYEYHVCGRGCELKTLQAGCKSWPPIFVAVVIFLAMSFMYKFGFSFIKKKLTARRWTGNYSMDQSEAEPSNGMQQEENRVAQEISSERAETIEDNARKTKRESSLDALRGIIITSMIFVNYGGGGFVFFEHAPWYGMTFADIIFPSFIFMMGASVALAIKSQLARAGNSFLLVFKHICIRSLKLFAIGLILNTDNTNLLELRIPGVLQRFAASYFVVACCHLMSVYRANRFLADRDLFPTPRQVVFIFAPETLIYVITLIIYLACTFGLQFDHCPRGYQGPGGMDQNARYFNCTGGAAGYIDRVVFGSKHIYQTPTSKEIYGHNLPYDPEGLLGTTTSILLCALGLITGRILIRHRNPYRRAVRMFMLIVTSGSTAFALAATGLIPVSKNLWSLSFVLATASLALVLLVILYLLIDVAKVWPTGWPFTAPGKNSILLYIGHEVGGRYFPFGYYVDPTSHSLLLMRTCISVLIWILVAIYLNSVKFYLTL